MLMPTDIYGQVAGLFINRDRAATLQSEAVTSVTATWDGFNGEAHGGLTRPSCSRVLRQYPRRGTEIRNTRQLTILSVEELAEIARRLGIPRLRPEWIGANLVMDGIPELTMLPPSSRLIFEGGASIVVDVENGPCNFPAEIIEAHHPGHGTAFATQARGLRGVVAWVEKPGRIEPGERARLHIPPQRLYAPAMAG
ncbi:MAG: MOSC domain-containing protein [Rhodobacteraceae bacterium]|nr:MOSC domain-containing protein [Paracoccaceae bacterium]